VIVVKEVRIFVAILLSASILILSLYALKAAKLLTVKSDRSHTGITPAGNRPEITNCKSSGVKTTTTGITWPKATGFGIESTKTTSPERIVVKDKAPYSVAFKHLRTDNGRAGSKVAQPVLVLMYHCVNNKTGFKNPVEKDLTIPIGTFVEELRWLRSNGYHVVRLDHAYHSIMYGKPLPPKPVILTFDDSANDHYLTVFPILKRFEISGTFFIKARAVENGEGLNWGAINEMMASGMEIESHTMNHADLSVEPLYAVKYELKESKELIEKRTGQKTCFLAYPSGEYNNRVIGIAKKCGYLGAFTTHYGIWRRDGEPFEIPRIRVSRRNSMKTFADSISKPVFNSRSVSVSR
jgi:peptidoglycan/xylan/chitin deacetylase (PgdA/CDA1 family)